MFQRYLLADTAVNANDVITNTVTETTFYRSTQIIDLNTDVGINGGRMWEFDAEGYVSSNTTTPGTLQLRLKVGATVVGQTALFTPPAAMANNNWCLSGYVVMPTCGTASSANGVGKLAARAKGYMGDGSSPVFYSMLTANTYGTGTSAWLTANTQPASNLSLTATWSVATTNNSITLQMLRVREINA